MFSPLPCSCVLLPGMLRATDFQVTVRTLHFCLGAGKQKLVITLQKANAVFSGNPNSCSRPHHLTLGKALLTLSGWWRLLPGPQTSLAALRCTRCVTSPPPQPGRFLSCGQCPPANAPGHSCSGLKGRHCSLQCRGGSSEHPKGAR